MPSPPSSTHLSAVPREEVEQFTIAAFRKHYRSAPQYVATAPGRVNLIGEHTDYNQGFVLPLAIDRFISVASAGRSDAKLKSYAENLQSSVLAPLADLIPTAKSSWANYIKGVAVQLQQRGDALAGADLLVYGNVPRGGGLSSSAALEMATAFTFLRLNRLEIPERDIISLCQKAENQFVGVQCGIMDQFVSCLGKEAHALLLDCRSLHFEHVPLPPGVTILVLDTGVRRALASSEYNKRREECTAAVQTLARHLPSVTSLRDVSPEQFTMHESGLDPIPRKRARHVITENARVLQAVTALRSGHMDEFGKLMYDSHFSLQHDYEVSCPELDAMVDICAECEGVLGARMTGAGFGGCAICLATTEAIEGVCSRVEAEYPVQTGKTPTIHICTAVDGATARSA